MSTISNKAEAVKGVFVEAALNMQTIKNANAEKLAAATNDDEKREFEAARKRAETHEKYNAALGAMSEKALNYLTRLNFTLDAQLISEQSREFKKRSVSMLEAIAASRRVSELALDNLLLRLAQKGDAMMTLAQIQREMNHKTTTQAQYFKTFAVLFHFAQYSKAEKALTFNYDAKVLKDMLKAYQVATAV